MKTALDFRSVSIIRGIGSLVVFAGFTYFAFTFAHNATYFVLEKTRIGLYLYHRFISMLLFVFFIAVNLGNIIVSYSTLYKSSEVAYLLTKPVPFTTVFLLKFFDNFFYSSTTLFLIGFAVLLGYGSYFGHEWYFYAGTMIFVFVPYMFLAACIAILVLMAVMKFAGKIGFRKVMAGIFAGYFALIFIFFSYSNPVKLVEEVNRFYPNVDIYFSQISVGHVQFLPNHWASEFLFYIAKGEVLNALPYAGILLTVTMLMFLLCIFVAHRYYYRSWLVSLNIQSLAMVPYNIKKVHWIDFRRGGFLSPQIDSFLKKDFFMFFREPSQWIHLLVMVVLTGIFVISASNLNLRLRVANMQLITYLVLFAFSGFMISSLALRFVFPMLELEGKSFWSIRSSPVRMEKWLGMRFLLGFVLVVFIAEIISIATNIPFVHFNERRPLLLWFGMYSGFWFSLTMVFVNLGFGGFFATYSERNPIRAASTQGATLTFLMTIVYLFILISVVMIPLSQYFTSLFTYYAQFDIRSIVFPGTTIAMISMIVSLIGWVVGLNSLKRDF